METAIIIIMFFGPFALFLAIASLSSSKKSRITGALLVFVWSGLTYTAASYANELEQNIWYGQAANDLLESSVEALNKGDVELVSTELSAMREGLQVTYEFRSNFKKLATETSKKINARIKP